MKHHYLFTLALFAFAKLATGAPAEIAPIAFTDGVLVPANGRLEAARTAVSADPGEPMPVRAEFPGTVAPGSARACRVESSDLDSSNELGRVPDSEVMATERAREDRASAADVVLAAATILALEWEVAS